MITGIACQFNRESRENRERLRRCNGRRTCNTERYPLFRKKWEGCKGG